MSLPLHGRLLLRLAPLPRDRRSEIEADLYELFVKRRTERGAMHAHGRLCRDIASLWHARRPPVSAATHNRQSTFGLLRDAGADVRYAVRLFARQPAILVLTIAGLSLGLAIATATFSIMNAAVLRGEGLADPDRAPGVIRKTDRSESNTWNYDEFIRLREGSTRMQLEAVVTDAAQVRTSAEEADPPSARVAFVSGGYFAAAGGRVIAGRPLEALDEQHTGPAPVVVSFGFWTTMLRSDPQTVGRIIRVGRTDAVIVGVAGRRFMVPNNRNLWMPMSECEAGRNRALCANGNVHVHLRRIDAGEVSRHYTDDDGADAIQLDGAPRDLRIGREGAPPECMPQNGRDVAASCRIGCGEQAANTWSHAEHGKEVLRDEPPFGAHERPVGFHVGGERKVGHKTAKRWHLADVHIVRV